MNNHIACCSYPTTILFIDDKKQFLEQLIATLNKGKDMAFKMCTEGKQALQEIREYSNPFALQQAKLTNVTDEYAEEYVPEKAHVVVDIDASNIYKAIYSEDRFKNIAVAIVDYAMPMMNGLEFAREAKKIGYKFIKILMLTGEADEALAVQAFNEGLIDKFIKKTSPSYIQDLNDSITKLQKDYFCDCSQALIAALATNQGCCLDEDVFGEFFNNLCKEKNICEYYLADEMGSFLLADKDGNTYWLVVNSETMLDNYASIAADGRAPKSIVQALKNKQKNLFLFTQKNLYLSINEWSKYMYPAQKLVGRKSKYYYSIIPGEKVVDFYPGKIMSYERYLDKLLH